MAKKKTSYCPIILRALRLMDAFAKSDDERDFYIDRNEGFILFVDLDSPQAELDALYAEVEGNKRYCLIPKPTFYETKKLMEGFTNEKVYDIDTKEKLLEIINGQDPREQFLEFLHDHHVELDKWLVYYQERSRIRIIEFLRNHEFSFAFEEDLDLPTAVIEKCKKAIFQARVSREVAAARKTIEAKAKTYYSNEALNPRPKRGRPPKHVAKVETEPDFSDDFYTTVPAPARPFLFVPNITGISSTTFSAKFETEEELRASMRAAGKTGISELDELSRKLASLRDLSSEVMQRTTAPKRTGTKKTAGLRRLFKRKT